MVPYALKPKYLTTRDLARSGRPLDAVRSMGSVGFMSGWLICAVGAFFLLKEEDPGAPQDSSERGISGPQGGVASDAGAVAPKPASFFAGKEVGSLADSTTSDSSAGRTAKAAEK